MWAAKTESSMHASDQAFFSYVKDPVYQTTYLGS